MAGRWTLGPLRSATVTRPGPAQLQLRVQVRTLFVLGFAQTIQWGCTPDQVGCHARSAEESEEAPTVVADEAPRVELREGAGIQYTLDFSNAHTQQVEVEAVVPTTEGSLTLMMPVWTPGSYMIREFARHIESFSVYTLDGDAIPFEKTAKNLWTPPANAEVLPERVVVRYRLHADDLTVRTNFVDADMASIHGAATFLTPVDDHERPLDNAFDIKLELHEGWDASYSGLAAHADEPHRFIAADYDELVDCPIFAGSPAVQEFEASGANHRLINFGGEGAWDGERALTDVQKIVETQHAFWGQVPYRSYTFFNLLLGGGGGLEHRNSTVIMGRRWATADEDDYRRWLGLVSHEFFHTWNVKRLRPISLGPFEYHRENYTRDLWLVEGVTSYYDDLLVRRAGLTDRDEYLEILSKTIERVQDTPGRSVQSLSESSFDAWIKFYRPDAQSRNSRISYYRKGSLIGWLLDARIRERSNKTLDDVMRLAFQRFPARGAGYTTEQFESLVAEVVGEDVSDFFEAAVRGTAELNYDAGLATFGLRFANQEDEPEPEAQLGVDVGDHHRVDYVRRDSAAWAAGINVGDELIALNDHRIGSDLAAAIQRFSPGDTIRVLLSRRGRIRSIHVELGQAQEASWTLELDPQASATQRRNLESWLGPEA